MADNVISYGKVWFWSEKERCLDRLHEELRRNPDGIVGFNARAGRCEIYVSSEQPSGEGVYWTDYTVRVYSTDRAVKVVEKVNTFHSLLDAMEWGWQEVDRIISR